MLPILIVFSSAIFVLQLSTLSFPLDGFDPSAGVVVAWCLSTGLHSFTTGVVFAYWFFWWKVRRRQDGLRDRFHRWGMDRDFPVRSSILSILVIAFVALSAFASVCFLGLSARRFVGDVNFLRLVLFWGFPFVLSFGLCWRRLSGVLHKVDELDGLASVFHERFPVSELLSMYECFRAVPRVFWEEWRGLPAVQVNETTNRRFRERVAPHTARLELSVQSAALLVSFLAACVALLFGLPAILDLFDLSEVLTDWLRGLW